MRTPAENDLLEACERGRSGTPVARALLLLQAAWPEHGAEELACLPLGRRNALLLDLRARCLGESVVGVVPCPRCGEAVEVAFAPQQMGIAPATVLPPLGEVHELRHGAYRARFRLPTSADLRGLADDSDAFTLGRRLLARCVVEIRRGKQACAERDWPDALADAVAARMAELDPHADITLAVQCTGCGHAWQQALDVGEFLYAEFAARARRLLDEIVRLASAFGWTEREILALPPARRQSYLERLEA